MSMLCNDVAWTLRSRSAPACEKIEGLASAPTYNQRQQLPTVMLTRLIRCWLARVGGGQGDAYRKLLQRIPLSTLGCLSKPKQGPTLTVGLAFFSSAAACPL